ncbi:MAG: hypothetical protein JST93_06520 [Acidobacteria bacterium]|nr:hypothetical protein [Acidobacteriota bacterium]
MSIFQDRARDLERYEFQMGQERGRLALTLDLLTDALVLVGQHGVYCQSARQPGKPAMDVQIVQKCINDAKELVGTVMVELHRKRAQANQSDHPPNQE